MLLLHPIKNDDYCIKTQEPKKGIYICTSFKWPKSLMQNELIIQFCHGAKSKLMPRTISKQNLEHLKCYAFIRERKAYS